MKAAVSLLLGISCLVWAADKRHWKAGRVLDSEAVNAYLESASALSPPAGQQTSLRHRELRRSDLMILGDESGYVIEGRAEKHTETEAVEEVDFYYDNLGRAIRNDKRGCSYIVNDWISYAYEGGNTLYVNDVHGKTCKLDIVRQERLQPKEILALENPAARSAAPAREALPSK
jgi:hypothetical protein